jgi:hypothetical protein
MPERTNAASGDQDFTQGAEFSVYGAREERTMQVVATRIS